MAATPYTDLDSVLANMQFQCEVSVLLAPFSAVILSYRLLNAGFLSNPLSDAEINTMLRLLTGCTVAVGSDLNCYPRGESTVICFDLDGNEIP